MPSRQTQILPPPYDSVVPLALEDFPSPSSAELVALPGGLYQGVSGDVHWASATHRAFSITRYSVTKLGEKSSRQRDKVVSYPRSIRDLYQVWARSKDVPFYALEVAYLPVSSGDGLLEAQWASLTLKS
ncbi:hypothetical protein BHE74_00011370 [Ensete ventricosum]|nr:hypothetical protein GW17_00041317 [Ensete ventricosum]RWW80294.1 hypothetical protein BHE74_00011370 [Ensete ventricosum]